jgi:hypothetical protein
MDINKNIFYTVVTVALSLFIWKGVQLLHGYNRYISTNGLSLRTVESDSAALTIIISNETDEIAAAQEKRAADKKEVLNFLQAQGFDTESISEDAPSIGRNTSGEHRIEGTKKYVISDKIVVKTNKVQLVEKSLSLAPLIDKGLDVTPTVTYHYSGMDKLRVEMVNEAAADSQNRAEQIAKTTNVKISGLRHLSTGSFMVLPEGSTREYSYDDGQYTLRKVVRVVVHGTFDLVS